jgi:DNA-binding MarR family transcriptional regulator
VSDDVADLAGRLRTEVNRVAYNLRTPATRLGITPTRLSALAALEKHPDGLRSGDLAARMGVSAASMTRLVDIMLEAGWVERERDPEDQRAWLLRLAAAGAEALAGFRRESTGQFAEDLAALSADQRAVLEAAVPVLRELADRALVPAP